MGAMAGRHLPPLTIDATRGSPPLVALPRVGSHEGGFAPHANPGTRRPDP